MTSEPRYVEASPASTIDRRYTVRREIARGGMGIVFEAEHSLTRSPVAVKVLTTAALGWPIVHARLMREARALAVARHPGVASVLDAGVCRSHGPYLVLEMIEGRSLESFIVARRTLDVESTVAVAQQLGAALSYVHSTGVVHRDVKPGNVLVTRDAGREGDVLKLLDFGIARVGEGDDVVERKLTQQTDVLGTIEYMAPEQILDGLPPTPGDRRVRARRHALRVPRRRRALPRHDDAGDERAPRRQAPAVDPREPPRRLAGARGRHPPRDAS
jgi:serine/threonine protein kinase